MHLMLYENERLHKDIQERIIHLLNEFKMLSTRTDLFNTSYIVYHGTTQVIHNTRQFITTSFLSTTRSFLIAKGYGNTNYAITIPKQFPAINLYDHLDQIILPIGTTIKIDDTIPNMSSNIIGCHVTNDPVILDTFINIFENPCTNDNNVTLNYLKQPSPLLEKFPNGQEFKPDTKITTVGSSIFFTATVAKTVFIIKDIVKRNNPVRVLASDNQVFKRVLNEVIASRIYSQVYGLSTMKYTM